MQLNYSCSSSTHHSCMHTSSQSSLLQLCFFQKFSTHLLLRRLVVKPAPKYVVQGGENNDATIHNNAPIHSHGRRVDDAGEEAEDVYRKQIAHGADIDWETPAPQTPAGWWQLVALETSEQHAADCDHIRGQQAAGVEGVDGVQRGGGANIDEGKEDGDD